MATAATAAVPPPAAHSTTTGATGEPDSSQQPPPQQQQQPHQHRGHRYHHHHNHQQHSWRVPVEEDPESFVPLSSALPGEPDAAAASADASASSDGSKFCTVSVSYIDRDYAPRPAQRLPASWQPVEHTSGVTLFFHKPTKVVTLARPYFIGSAPLRNHLVPLACVPCLGYRAGLQAASLLKPTDAATAVSSTSRGVQTGCDDVDVAAAADDAGAAVEAAEANNDVSSSSSNNNNAEGADNTSDIEEGEIATSDEEATGEKDQPPKPQENVKVSRKRKNSSNSNIPVAPAPAVAPAASATADSPASADDTAGVGCKRPRLAASAPGIIVVPPLPPTAPSAAVVAPVCPAAAPGSSLYIKHSELRQYCRRLFLYRTGQRQVCKLTGQSRPIQLPPAAGGNLDQASAPAAAAAADPAAAAGAPPSTAAAAPVTAAPPRYQTVPQQLPRRGGGVAASASAQQRETPHSKLILLTAESGRRERLINPVGKMPASVIADLQVSPDRQFRYEYQRLSDTELRCNLLSHDGRQLGTAVGKNKKVARHLAALSGLEALVPNFDQFKDDLLQHPALIADVDGGKNAQQQKAAPGSSQQPQQHNKAPSTAAASASAAVAAAATATTAPDDVPDDFKAIGSADPRAVELLKQHKLPRMRCLLADYMRRYCIEDSELRIDYAAATAPQQQPATHGYRHRLHTCCLTLRGSQSGQCSARSKAAAYDLAAQRLLAQAYPMAGSFYSILKLVGPRSHAAQKNDFSEVHEQLKSSDRGELKKGLLDMLRRKLRELSQSWTEHGPQFKGKFYDWPDRLERIEPHPDSALPTFALAASAAATPASAADQATPAPPELAEDEASNE